MRFGIVFIKNVDFQAGGAGKIVRCFPGHKFHRFGGSGIGIGKPLGYAGVAIARPEALCKQFLIPLFQQSAIAGQDFRRSASMLFTAGARNSVMAPFREFGAAAVQSFQSVPSEK